MRSTTQLAAALVATLCSVALPVTAWPVTEDPAGTPQALAADPAPAPRPGGRELGGHVFMPALGLVMPFATTSFGTYLTLGEGTTHGSISLHVPGAPADAPPQTFSGTVSYAAIGGALGYEHALAPWLSARLRFTETLYTGTTGAAVVVVGSNARLGLGAGLTAGLPLGDTVRVAAILDAGYAPRMGLLLGPALKDAYQRCSSGLSNCEFDFSKLFEQKNVLHLEPGVAISWAPHRSLGLTGNLSYASDSIDTSGSGTVTEGGVSVGGAADFDFNAISPVALGLQVTWNSMIPLSGGTDRRYTDLGGGLFYTGRKDLSLGLQFVVRRFKVAPAVDVSWSTVVATMGLRYYW
jgi:hypothetical protein